MAVLTAVLGPERAKLFSPHSWRVWLASALRMCHASDGLIMAFGRWLNPESVKIYAHLGTADYCHWMDKIMQVHRIDVARTTNLSCMDVADALEAWSDALEGSDDNEERWRTPEAAAPAALVLNAQWRTHFGLLDGYERLVRRRRHEQPHGAGRRRPPAASHSSALRRHRAVAQAARVLALPGRRAVHAPQRHRLITYKAIDTPNSKANRKTGAPHATEGRPTEKA